MASSYYINTGSFKTCTSIYLDEKLDNVAADGFYEFEGSYREQVGGLLLPLTDCPHCAEYVECEKVIASGGANVSEYSITMDEAGGGIIVLEFNADSVVDKLELIHNGVKKATTGMTTPNEGPFDNLYGDPTVPTVSEANAVDQFIGTSKGAVPSRQAAFTLETSSTLTLEAGYQQLIWWEYSSVDYDEGSELIVRVTGVESTAWNFKRLCE